MNLDHDTCYRALTMRGARSGGRFFTRVRTTRVYVLAFRPPFDTGYPEMPPRHPEVDAQIFKAPR